MAPGTPLGFPFLSRPSRLPLLVADEDYWQGAEGGEGLVAALLFRFVGNAVRVE